MNRYFIEPNGTTIHTLEPGTTLEEAVAHFRKLGFRITGRLLKACDLQADFLSPLPAEASADNNPSITTTH